ncbi:hypothetical protein GGQ84_000333 [Desulfitispora alkaliphila]|uniref:TIGR01777 family oxidoreductase n=1 Tax=Desulfitispora alkaliphila TaxID=622674 RepID=UPI003D215096
MKILITGGTGFIGSEVCKKLVARGHHVVVLTRINEKPRANLNLSKISFVEYPYAPDSIIPSELMADIEGIINMAGEPIFSGRWTEPKKQRILDSRVNITKQLVDSIASLPDKRPEVLVSASAVGYYGPSDDSILDESAPPGSDFLAQVCRRWEEEAMKATASGTRTVTLRTGIVLDKGGGALAQMVPPFKYFVGGPIGGGKQYFSWIHREDMVDLYVQAVENPNLSGAVNATSPNPVTMGEVSLTLGRVLNRPSWLPVPAFMAKMLMGESAQVVVTGQRVIPQKLLAAGFKFKYSDIQHALKVSLKNHQD